MTKAELLAVAKNCAENQSCKNCPLNTGDPEDECITNVMKELIALVERGEVSAGR